MSDLLQDIDWVHISEILKDYDPFPDENKQSTKNNNEDNGRFVVYDDEEASRFIRDQENEGTKKETRSDMNQFQACLSCQNESRNIEQLSQQELVIFFRRFLLGARKIKDKSEYEPSSLRSFMSSLDRHLKNCGCTVSVLNHPDFPHSNAALIAKQKELKAKGNGNKPKESDELTDSDIDKLFNEGILGLNSPLAVLNMLYLNFSLVLGMHGGKEQTNLKLGDNELTSDEDGDEYLVHVKERATKTRTGLDITNVRKFKPKALNCDIPERCPVKAFKLYASKRPANMLSPELPFFLAINVKEPKPGQAWLKNNPMGINKIYQLTKNMKEQCSEIDNDRRITNHSVRKHLVQICCDLQLAPTDTVQISGHKNVQSVNNYSRMSNEKQKMVSKALGKTKCFGPLV